MKIESLNESEWREEANPCALCKVKFDALIFKNKFNLKPLVYIEDGLSECTAFLFKILSSKYWVRSFLEYEDQRPFIYVDVPSTESDSLIAYERLVKTLNLKDIEWHHEDLGPASWILSRLDDNGNEIEMGRYLEDSSAEFIRRKYEKKGHKQTYYVRKKT